MTDQPKDPGFPEIVVGPSGWKFAVTMAIASFLIGGAWWVVIRILNGTAPTDFPAVPLVVCGIGGLVASVWMLLSLHARIYGQPRLRIDATGISDPSDRFSLGTIPWAQIRDVRTQPRKQVIWLLVDDKPAILAQMHPLRRPLIWFDSAFARDIIKLKTWRLEISHDHLLGILAHYHRQFGHPRP